MGSPVERRGRPARPPGRRTRPCSTTQNGDARQRPGRHAAGDRLGRRPGPRVRGAGRRGQPRARSPTRAARAPSWSPASAPPAVTGDILATVAGPRCPVPVIGHRSAGVPGWVGAADVVIAVCAVRPQPGGAGRRRGRRPPRRPAGRASARPTPSCRRSPSGPVRRSSRCRGARPARASLWALTVPVLLAARTLGLVKVNEADLAETAARLDADAERCRPGAESFVNPAKSLALGLAGSVPIVWGSSPLATVAARRFADTLAANARYPVVAGALGEAGRGRVGLLDGVFGGLAESRPGHLRRPGATRRPDAHPAAPGAAARRRPQRRGRRRRADRRRGAPRRRGADPGRAARRALRRAHRRGRLGAGAAGLAGRRARLRLGLPCSRARPRPDGGAGRHRDEGAEQPDERRDQ